MDLKTQTPTSRVRLSAILWLVGSLLSTVGLMVYLTLSSRAESRLAQLSEEPHPFTAILIGSSVIGLAIVMGPGREHFPKWVLRRMRIGTAAGIAGLLSYSFYVYSFSALPPAPDAPLVGDRAPDFAVTDPDGRVWALSEFKGDVLVFFYRGHW